MLPWTSHSIPHSGTFLSSHTRIRRANITRVTLTCGQRKRKVGEESGVGFRRGRLGLQMVLSPRSSALSFLLFTSSSPPPHFLPPKGPKNSFKKLQKTIKTRLSANFRGTTGLGERQLLVQPPGRSMGSRLLETGSRSHLRAVSTYPSTTGHLL